MPISEDARRRLLALAGTPATGRAAAPRPAAKPPSRDAAPAHPAPDHRKVLGARDPHERTAALLRRLERLPINPPVALRVLPALDDPRTDAVELARIVKMDPALTARLLKVANSAYYAPVTPVTNLQTAVSLLGRAALRSVATMTAAGLEGDQARKVPDGFWLHAAQCGIACSAVAGRVGAAAQDAFTLGVLHDLGVALLSVCDHGAYEGVLDRIAESGATPADVEMSTFGTSRGEAAARVFAAWRFPDRFVAAVAAHHGAGPASNDPLERALRLGDAVAHLASGAPPYDPRPGSLRVLEAAHLDDEDARMLVRRVEVESETLAAALGG